MTYAMACYSASELYLYAEDYLDTFQPQVLRIATRLTYRPLVYGK